MAFKSINGDGSLGVEQSSGAVPDGGPPVLDVRLGNTDQSRLSTFKMAPRSNSINLQGCQAVFPRLDADSIVARLIGRRKTERVGYLTSRSVPLCKVVAKRNRIIVIYAGDRVERGARWET